MTKPLGFGSWQASVATVLGLVAKEEVVGALGTIYAVSGEAIELVEEGAPRMGSFCGPPAEKQPEVACEDCQRSARTDAKAVSGKDQPELVGHPSIPCCGGIFR